MTDRTAARKSRSWLVPLAVAVLLLTLSAGSFPIAGAPHREAGDPAPTVGISPSVANGSPPSPGSLRTGPAERSVAANPTVPYDVANVTLPAWNNLSQYAWNCNSNVSGSVVHNCFTPGGPRLGFAGLQVPLLSWTADGAFYVNASFDLVFYSFVNHSVVEIAPWLPLYDAITWYTAETNTEFITSDGAYIYEFGCLANPCLLNSSSPVTSYAVNVSTGRTFEHQWGSEIRTGTGNEVYTPYWNAQMNMVGVAGNDSIMTLTVTWTRAGSGVTNGTIWAYNIWTGAEWKLADLPFFEANNLYWISEFQQFFDVSADDTHYDSVAQVILSGGPAQPDASVWGPVGYTSPTYGIGGVGGLWINLSSRQVGFSTDWQGHGEEFAVLAQLNASGVLAGFPRVSGPFPDGAEPAATSGEHRYTLVTGGPSFATSPAGQPTTWLADPRTNSTFWSTNVSQEFAAWDLDGSLFYNTSYSILTASVQCNRVGQDGTDCAIAGTAPGTSPGTITWAWRAGSPEFPFSPTAPRAEAYAPQPWSVSASPGPDSVDLTWTAPANQTDPVINFSLAWAPVSGGETDHVALPGNTTTYVIGGLIAGETIRYQLAVWNLHWRCVTNGSAKVTSPAIPSPPVVTVAAVFASTAVPSSTATMLVTLTEPPNNGWPLVNDTLYWGLAPTPLTFASSARNENLPVGSGSVAWTIDGLALNATYYVVGTTWNTWGESPASAEVVAHTPSGGSVGCGGACGAAHGSSRPFWPILIPGLAVAGGATIAALALATARRPRDRRPRPPG